MVKKSIKLKAGDRFGRLMVVKLDYIKKYVYPKGNICNREYYLCKCDCGNFKTVAKCVLKEGKSNSCGCLITDTTKKLFTKHGLKNHRLYGVWNNIKERTGNKKNNHYHCYGGRGITLCDEWKNDFKTFYDWAVENGYKENKGRNLLTIDRINNDGNYEPSNCRWATDKEQSVNKSTNRLITYKGIAKCINEWAKEFNLKGASIISRLRVGWSIEEALTLPRGTKRKAKKKCRRCNNLTDNFTCDYCKKNRKIENSRKSEKSDKRKESRKQYYKTDKYKKLQQECYQRRKLLKQNKKEN